MNDDRRLIEDYLPIQAISKEASREKSVRKGHISTLHLWWARRPLVACRAAVYGALVPASQFVPSNGPDNKKQSLGRANAAKFVTELCKYPGISRVIEQAQEHILDAHAERLTAELAEAAETGQWPAWVDEFKWPKNETQVTGHDIEKGRAPRPRVLDMFAGGGAIPLETLRLGCAAYALDLNPVAHIIQLCTLVYPQKYGKPDPAVPGMTGPPLQGANQSRNRKGTDAPRSWGGLAEEVRYWGHWVLERVRRQIGDLYPPVPDPAYRGRRPAIEFDPRTGRWVQKAATAPVAADSAGRTGRASQDQGPGEFPWAEKRKTPDVPRGYLTPVAYLWTRTVRCKNPACGATVPLVRQTWLCKKKGRCVALRMIAPPGRKRVRFEVVQSGTEKGLGFDPAGFSKAGNATCPFCGTVADNDYVKAEGRAGRMGTQPMAVVCTRPGARGKVYLAADELPSGLLPDDDAIRRRIDELCERTGLAVPDEPIEINPRSMDVDRWGLTTFGHLFTPRQMLCLLTFTAAVREAHEAMAQADLDGERAKAVGTYLGLLVDRTADMSSTLCRWLSTLDAIATTFGRQALPMTWDFAESAPFGGASGGVDNALAWIIGVLSADSPSAHRAAVTRGSATALPWGEGQAGSPTHFDAVLTDPPYYDNVSYSNLSDFFYVWLRRSVGHLHPEHFATVLTPKKSEVIAAFYRHEGDKAKSRRAYEQMMAASLAEAHRVLKPGGVLAVVYAHKTTLGWSTLVDALRRAGFTVTEAWPLDTERKSRLIAMETAALASSIFLVGRKRAAGARAGSYEDDVLPELHCIVRERVETLWEQGITGADLVIAAIGAGLRAFTRYDRVEYANGEEVPAERFLAEVEGVVLDVMLEQIAGKVARGVTAVDPASRFYVLWRYVYKAAAVEAGEAIVFSYGQQVELDGPQGLAGGRNPLLEKKKGKYRLRDFTERGGDEKLGLPPENGQPGETAPLIDALHRVLWTMEHRPRMMSEFLRESGVNRDRLRVLAQALAGPALKGGELGEVSAGGELAALTKLTANWKSVIEDAISPLERSAR